MSFPHTPGNDRDRRSVSQGPSRYVEIAAKCPHHQRLRTHQRRLRLNLRSLVDTTAFSHRSIGLLTTERIACFLCKFFHLSARNCCTTDRPSMSPTAHHQSLPFQARKRCSPNECRHCGPCLPGILRSSTTYKQSRTRIWFLRNLLH